MRSEQCFYDEAANMHDLVWRVCCILHNLKQCKQCPHAEYEKGFGLVHKGCRMMAEETIAMVLEAKAIKDVEVKI